MLHSSASPMNLSIVKEGEELDALEKRDCEVHCTLHTNKYCSTTYPAPESRGLRVRRCLEVVLLLSCHHRQRSIHKAVSCYLYPKPHSRPFSCPGSRVPYLSVCPHLHSNRDLLNDFESFIWWMMVWWWMASRNYRIMVRVCRGIPTGYMRHLLHTAIRRKGIQNLVVYFCTMLPSDSKMWFTLPVVYVCVARNYALRRYTWVHSTTTSNLRPPTTLLTT